VLDLRRYWFWWQ